MLVAEVGVSDMRGMNGKLLSRGCVAVGVGDDDDANNTDDVAVGVGNDDESK